MSQQQKRNGITLVVCAPSGAGKTTLTKRLVKEFPRFAFSVSYTTRAPRPGEVDGVDYHFISSREFLQRCNSGFFAEWAEVHGNYYGTPLEATYALLADGRDVLFDIDVQGAAQIRRTIPGARLVFIFPPSMAELERRLRSRGTETEESILQRLEAARGELIQAHWFDLWVVNDSLEEAWEELRAAYLAATLSPQCRTSFLAELVQDSMLSAGAS